MDSDKADRLSEPDRHEVRRIVLEAVTNAARHAQATRVRVSLSESAGREGTLELLVADHGIGFCPDLVEASPGHFGLRGLRERAKRLGTEIRIASEPGKGSRIVLKWPAERAAIVFNLES